MKAPEFLENNEAVLKVIPTGSRYICNPPVMDTDEDWAVLIDNYLVDEFIRSAEDAGYYRTNREYAGSGIGGHLITFRHPDNPINLIVHLDDEQFDAFAEATLIAKEENLTDKADRIALFEKLRTRVHRKQANRMKYENSVPYYFDYDTWLRNTKGQNNVWFDLSDITVAGEDNN